MVIAYVNCLCSSNNHLKDMPETCFETPGIRFDLPFLQKCFQICPIQVGEWMCKTSDILESTRLTRRIFYLFKRHRGWTFNKGLALEKEIFLFPSASSNVVVAGGARGAQRAGALRSSRPDPPAGAARQWPCGRRGAGTAERGRHSLRSGADARASRLQSRA